MRIAQTEPEKKSDRKRPLFLLMVAMLIVVIGLGVYMWWPQLTQLLGGIKSWSVDDPLWKWIGMIAKGVGFVVAAVWAYFNFVKSREYYPRMELSCSASVFASEPENRLLLPRITLKHIGKSKITIDQEGSAYKVLFSDGRADPTKRITWKTDGKHYTLFVKHRWIEPGESIFQESEVFVIPAWAVAAKVEARILGRVRPILREKIIVWNNAVVSDCGTKGKEPTDLAKGAFNALSLFC